MPRLGCPRCGSIFEPAGGWPPACPNGTTGSRDTPIVSGGSRIIRGSVNPSSSLRSRIPFPLPSMLVVKCGDLFFASRTRRRIENSSAQRHTPPFSQPVDGLCSFAVPLRDLRSGVAILPCVLGPTSVGTCCRTGKVKPANLAEDFAVLARREPWSSAAWLPFDFPGFGLRSG